MPKTKRKTTISKSTKEKLTAELQSAVAELEGFTPQQIAKAVAKRQIRGRPGTTGRCPLALLMQGRFGGKFIVGQEYIFHPGGQNNHVLANSGPSGRSGVTHQKKRGAARLHLARDVVRFKTA